MLVILVAVTLLAVLPVLADETVEESQIVREVAREMMRQGVPEEGALHLARQNRFMAEMVAGILERQALSECDCEPLGGGEQEGSCELAETGEFLQTRARTRAAQAFGRALGSAYANYGEEECAQAAMVRQRLQVAEMPRDSSGGNSGGNDSGSGGNSGGGNGDSGSGNGASGQGH